VKNWGFFFLFKLVEKIQQNDAFSWNRMHLARRGMHLLCGSKTKSFFSLFHVPHSWVQLSVSFLSFSLSLWVFSFSELVLRLRTKFPQLIMSSKVSWIFISWLPCLHEISYFAKLHHFSIQYFKNTYEFLGLGKNYNYMTRYENIIKYPLNHEQLF